MMNTAPEYKGTGANAKRFALAPVPLYSGIADSSSPGICLINGLVTGASRALSEQGRQARVIQWNWGRDYAQHFSSQSASAQDLTMRADGALALRLFPSSGAPTPLWYSFLLLHAPLDDVRLFRQRLDWIVRWREAEAWTPERQMPLVLILATTPRQAEWWHQAASQVARRLHTDELVGAVACWPTSQPQSIFQGRSLRRVTGPWSQ